jgi:ABC-type nitrate/sulfonate/bicarbonate transport system ATPase subunit
VRNEDTTVIAETSSVQTSARDGVELRVEELSKLFLPKNSKPVLAMSKVSVDVRTREVLALLGPSGCGKSTLLRVIGGLDTDYQGIVEWEQRSSEAGRLAAATVFQQDSTLPWFNVADNIGLGLSGLKLSKRERTERIERYSGLVGLEHFRSAYPHELSGGMRQRVAIARALAAEPHVLLMDEPLAALDAQTRIVMQAELAAIWRRTGSTVVYVTHDIEEAITLADRIIVMTARPGRIKSERYVSFQRTTDDGRLIEPLELRRLPGFGQLALDLWGDLADEVGNALSSEREGPGR